MYLAIIHCLLLILPNCHKIQTNTIDSYFDKNVMMVLASQLPQGHLVILSRNWEEWVNGAMEMNSVSRQEIDTS